MSVSPQFPPCVFCDDDGTTCRGCGYCSTCGEYDECDDCPDCGSPTCSCKCDRYEEE